LTGGGKEGGLLGKKVWGGEEKEKIIPTNLERNLPRKGERKGKHNDRRSAIKTREGDAMQRSHTAGIGDGIGAYESIHRKCKVNKKKNPTSFSPQISAFTEKTKKEGAQWEYGGE